MPPPAGRPQADREWGVWGGGCPSNRGHTLEQHPMHLIYTRIFGPRFARPRFFRLTFWPRFYGSRNYQRYQVGEKDRGQCGTDMCTECWCGSCSDSRLGWRDDICKILPGSREILILLLLDMLDFQGFVFEKSSCP